MERFDFPHFSFLQRSTGVPGRGDGQSSRLAGNLGRAILVLLLGGWNVPGLASVVPEDNASVLPGASSGEEVNATALRSAGAGDAEITRRIREMIVQDRRLSEPAEEVRIATQGGRVTVEGEVLSLAERMNLLKKAASVVGSRQVVDRLVIRAAE